jgi:hypothetical protein
MKVPVAYYGSVTPGLFTHVINKYMDGMPHGDMHMDMPAHGNAEAKAAGDMQHMQMDSHDGEAAMSSSITPVKAEK